MSEIVKKRKRKSYSILDKLLIINEFEKGEKIETLCKKHDVARRSLCNWIKNKDKLKAHEQTHILDNKIKRMRRGPFEMLDEAIYLWFDRCMRNGVPMTGSIIKEKAKELYQHFKIERPFVASEGWLNNWKKRYNILEYARCEEKLSADTSAANIFKEDFEKYIGDEHLTLSQIFNADDIGLNFKQMPKKTLAEKSKATPSGLKVNKDRVTVMVCSNADGTFKMPLVIIGNLAKPRVIKNALGSLPAYYASNKSAWMTSVIFQKWFKEEFVPRVTEFLRSKNLPLKALLLLDNLSTETLQEGDIKVKNLPPNAASIIQPMDQGIIENLKKVYRKLFIASIIHADKNNIQLAEYLKSVNIKNFIDWISEAWNNVKVETIFKCWKNLLPISYYENIVEDCNIEKNNSEILTNVRRIAEFENIDEQCLQDWITSDEGNNLIPTNSELYEMLYVDNTSNDENDTSMGEDTDTEDVIQPEKAFTAANTLLSFFRQNNILSTATLAALNEAKEAIIQFAIDK